MAIHHLAGGNQGRAEDTVYCHPLACRRQAAAAHRRQRAAAFSRTRVSDWRAPHQSSEKEVGSITLSEYPGKASSARLDDDDRLSLRVASPPRRAWWKKPLQPLRCPHRRLWLVIKHHERLCQSNVRCAVIRSLDQVDKYAVGVFEVCADGSVNLYFVTHPKRIDHDLVIFVGSAIRTRQMIEIGADLQPEILDDG